jgi:hypothetical protein
LETDGTLSIVGNLDYDQPLSLPLGGNFQPACDREPARPPCDSDTASCSRSWSRFRLPRRRRPAPAFPPRAERAGKLLGFDGDGDFAGVLPGPGDASELALDMLSTNP